MDSCLGSWTKKQIERVLQTERIGRIACHADGRLYVVPISYACDGHSMYAHSAEGLKLRMMRANPDVCFEVDEVDSVDHWHSVIAWGRFEELHGPDAEQGMQLLVERFLPRGASETALLRPAEVASRLPTAVAAGHAVMFRINLVEKTGRFERNLA
jgi:nitroimidazol reductase NimA-like FMN-containing flavoprotein (pyridoxamine 5'-phosphate oxidase superfamily)